MELDLTGKRALVCGSTQGIGWATALELAELGAEVILMARDASKLKNRASELSAARGQKHGYVVADFHHPEAVAEAADALVSEKPVQILINNTGGPPPGPAHLADVADFRSAFELHLVNNQRLLQSCLPGMKEAGYGRVVNVISTSVRIPLKGLGVSNTIRGAVASWAKTVSNEVAGFGITVNNVLPGATETERLHQIIANKAQKTASGTDEVAVAMRREIPAGRFGRPEELAAVIAFLCSPAAGYVNGVSIPVDGGRTGTI
ncbi:MAG: SDR family oxidoreductase [Flavobacteriia bacterium]|nr:SDR family oxidoreductase [Flavobacteriia bacterium]